jgi:hypothetical protein
MLRSAPSARLEARSAGMQLMPPYQEQFAVGSKVRIANISTLQEFARTWTQHHYLGADQLRHAEQIGVVAKVGFYHGGDVLYELDGIPGIWHEQCLQPLRCDHP